MGLHPGVHLQASKGASELYSRRQGQVVSRVHLRQGLSGCLKIETRAGACKEQDTNSSG